MAGCTLDSVTEARQNILKFASGCLRRVSRFGHTQTWYRAVLQPEIAEPQLLSPTRYSQYCAIRTQGVFVTYSMSIEST
jgi:hypothetical protein